MQHSSAAQKKAYWNLADTREFHYNQAILRKVDKKRTEKDYV